MKIRIWSGTPQQPEGMSAIGIEFELLERNKVLYWFQKEKCFSEYANAENIWFDTLFLYDNIREMKLKLIEGLI